MPVASVTFALGHLVQATASPFQARIPASQPEWYNPLSGATTYWSALDNFEWTSGYRPTFGLIAVDRRTQQRSVKPSTRWLGYIARAHGF